MLSHVLTIVLFVLTSSLLQRLDLPPFLSYAASYALFNYTLENPSRGYEYDNLRLIRGFENGLDPKSSEAGFILTHVDMVKETAPLIHGAVQILDGVEHNSRRAAVNEGFREILKAMEVIEASMEGTSLFLLFLLYRYTHH